MPSPKVEDRLSAVGRGGSEQRARTCRDLQVLLVDGTLHTARFSFK
jgi:hypothetical protein